MSMKLLKNVFAGILIAVFLVSCAKTNAPATTADNGSADAKLQTALTGTLDQQWELVVAQAKQEGTVNFEMWIGSESINRWVDTFVIPGVKDKYGITVNRIGAGDAIVDRILSETASNVADANDVLWTNGVTSMQLISQNLMYGPVVQRMPNYVKYYDSTAQDQIVDFGYPNMGYETPYTRTQFTLIYDSAKIPNPPKSLQELTEWIKANPGRFTYPNPNVDFTGDAFLKTVFYATNSAGGYKPFLTGFDQALLDTSATTTWEWFNEIKPYLWREGTTYPETLGQLEVMYQNGEVDWTMSYGPARGSQLIAEGKAPETTRSLVLTDGTVANSNFLGMYINAPHKAAAMVLMNFMMDPETQLSLYDPVNWGDMPTLDLSKLAPDMKAKFDAVDVGVATPSLDVLNAHSSPEISSSYADPLHAGWVANVLNK